MGLQIKSAVRLSLLERVTPSLLVRFLKPHEPYLRARDVRLEDVEFDHDWVRQLHRALTSVEHPPPGRLSQALMDIADVAHVDGQEAIIDLLRRRRLRLFEGARLTPDDMALRLYLEHPELFRDSLSRIKSQEARNFVDFVGVGAHPLENLEVGREVMLERLRAWFEARNRTNYVDVRLDEGEREVVFTIIHGQPPRSLGVVRDHKHRERMHLVPDKRDVVVVERDGSRLSVNAQYLNEKEHYRHLIGEVFFGDPDHFQTVNIISGAPLLVDPAEALSVEGFPEIKAARLRLVRLVDAGISQKACTLQDCDLLEAMKRPISFTSGPVEVDRFELELDLPQRRHPLVVRAARPNRLKYDRRSHDGVVREFLLSRGFLLFPHGGSLREAC